MITKAFFEKLINDWCLIGIGIAITGWLANYYWAHPEITWSYAQILVTFGWIGIMAKVGMFFLNKWEKKIKMWQKWLS